MHQASNKQHALVGIMHHCYEDIRTTESQYGIVVDAGDLRARIEYFHDAVRALMNTPELIHEKRGRLCVEWLAYDLSCLRYIQDKPLARLNHAKPAPSKTSANKAMVISEGGAAGGFRQPPPEVRAQLGNLYRTYTVLFAGLFAETTDRNYHSRLTEYNTEVEDLAQIEQMLQMMEKGQIEPVRVEEAIQHLQNEDMKTRLMIMLHERSQKKRRAQDAIAQIKTQIKSIDQEIASMDKAHMSFLSGQMMLLQDSKDLVKKLSAQGMNLAGQFLDNAMSAAAGRGAGRNR